MRLVFLLLTVIGLSSLKAQLPINTPPPSLWGQAAFEENKGQILDAQDHPADYVQYHFQKGNMNIYMLPSGIAYQFNHSHRKTGNLLDVEHTQSIEATRLETFRMDMELLGANPNPSIIAEEKNSDVVHYYNHDVLNVQRFKKLTYKAVYPGIDWVIYTTEKGLKYDFIVHPGAHPNQIQLRFKHQEGLTINKNGSLTISSRLGDITEQAPVSFQGKKELRSAFVQKDDVIRFKIEGYNPNQPLIIDPNLVWSSYYGGSGEDRGEGIAVDANGNIYLTGSTVSTTAIAMGGYQTSLNGNSDAFLVKFNSAGVRQWATYYGGSDGEAGLSCAVDANGNSFVSGLTSSSNGIAFNGHQDTYGGALDAFLVKFNSAGIRQWATYYGGNGTERGYSCMVDINNNIFIIGQTFSSTGIASTGHQNTIGGGTDAFMVKFNTNGVRQWGTYYGGSDSERYISGAIDTDGNLYISGSTNSNNNIALNGYQNTISGSEDAFIGKFNNNGVFQWGTYYGGANTERGGACAADASGNIYLAGSTFSTNGIYFNGHQSTYSGGGTPGDAFLVKFNANGVRQWGTYYGGNGGDFALSCLTNSAGNVFLAGSTNSSYNMASGGFQNSAGGGTDSYIVEFNTNGVRQWGTYYGSTSYDFLKECTLDANGYLYITGYTASTTRIGINGYQNTIGGNDDAFFAKLTSSTISPCTPTTNSITSSTCGSFSYNGQTYTTSGTYQDTLVNVGGCDSIVTLNLTIGSATYGVNTVNYAPYTLTNATTVTLTDDELSAPLPIGFQFNFFGNIYTTFNISSNGFISFGNNTSDGCCTGQTLPDTSSANNLIALAWEDLIPPNGGQISYTTLGTAPNRILVVEFSNIEHYSSGDSIQGQIHLYEGFNTIDIHLGRQPHVGIHTLGIENSTGTLSYSPANRNGTTWSITSPEAWRFAPLIGGFDVQTACNSYTWIDGITYTSNNSSATHIISGGSASGCDSIVRLNLIIYNDLGGSGQLTENMEGGILFSGTGYSYDLTNASIYNPDNIPIRLFSVLDGTTYGYGASGGFANSNRSVRFSTYDVPAGNEMAVIMKKIDLDCNAGVSFSYAHQNYPNASDTLQVEVSNDCGATWTTVWRKSGAALATAGSSRSRFLTPTANDWSSDTADLSAYNNTNDVLVKFTVLSGFGNNIYLDDINIYSGGGTATRTITACGAYTAYGQTYTQSGIYTTRVNAPGACDSIITLDLTIGQPSTRTDVITACNAYTWIDGITYTASNNTATALFTTASGCDSIVTLDLTIYQSPTRTDVITACNAYTWIDGITYTASNNTATALFTTASGCDSIVTLDLTIYQPSTGTDVQTACNSFTWINGITYTASNNTATFTLTNAAGCDSIVTLDLTIYQPSTGTDVQTACNSFTWIDGITYTASNNTATFTLTNAAGCDSIVTLDLTINTVDVSTTLNGLTIMANATGTGTTYQWMDCANDSILATSASFTPTTSGNYAVIITQNSCVDTSTCVNVTVIGIEDASTPTTMVAIYPNPTRGVFMIDLKGLPEAQISIYAANGQLVQQQTLQGQGIHQLQMEGTPGVYFLQIQVGDQMHYHKLIKK